MIELVRRHILPAAYSILPLKMNTLEATALMYTIGLQESRFDWRDQADPLQREGPALGPWQFEKGGGVKGVLLHPASKAHLWHALDELKYKKRVDQIHPTDVKAQELYLWTALEHNDILAAVMARLLLYTDPKALPSEVLGPTAGWLTYTRNWRPGKPHRETWDEFWRQGWLLARQGF